MTAHLNRDGVSEVQGEDGMKIESRRGGRRVVKKMSPGDVQIASDSKRERSRERNERECE
jgi:hypothetical protein